jgi:phosphatidate cytidylyltransferase
MPTQSSAPAKMTKTALKKAKKAALEAKRKSKANGAAVPPASAGAAHFANDSHPSSSVPDSPETKPAASLQEEIIDITSAPPTAALPQESVPAKIDDVEDIASTGPAPAPPPKDINYEPVEEVTAAPPPPPAVVELPKEAKSVIEPAKGSAPAPLPAADAEKAKKRQNVLTRTIWTLIMIGGFIGMSSVYIIPWLTCPYLLEGLLLMGHAYMIILVLICQTIVYREVTALFSLKSVTPESKDVEPLRGKDPWSKTLNWYFFAVTNYFLYGESIIYYFKVHKIILRL